MLLDASKESVESYIWRSVPCEVVFIYVENLQSVLKIDVQITHRLGL